MHNNQSTPFNQSQHFNSSSDKHHEVADLMQTDGDSRDSGVCDMDYTSMPTSFEANPSAAVKSMEVQMNAINSDALMDEDDSEYFAELMKLPSEASENLQPTFDDLSLGATSKKSIQQALLRRKNESITYDESPKSRACFARPVLANLNSNTALNRKRTCPAFSTKDKRLRNAQGEPEVLAGRVVFGAYVSPSRHATRSTQGTTLQRAMSTSVVETGQVQYEKEATVYHLETCEDVCSPAFRRITASTLAKLLDKGLDYFKKNYLLIDCRYPYEYEGGHIKTAVSLFDPSIVGKMFFKPQKVGYPKPTESRTLIFYCEYSQKRGPSMAYALRAFDRNFHSTAYPNLAYDEMYVLDKGYINFFREHMQSGRSAELCEPNNHIEMVDKRFTEDLKMYSFHKKSFVMGTSVKPADSVSRQTLRSLSSGTPTSNLQRSSSAHYLNNRLSHRSLNFTTTSKWDPSAFKMEIGEEPRRTPSPENVEPIVRPQFS